MSRMTLVSAITEDRESVVLEMREEQTPLAHTILDSASTEQIIRDLGRCRVGLAEQVPGELDPGARLEVEHAPAWRIPDQHSGPEDHVLLALRHPGLGWLGFLLEPERARQIGEALMARATPQPPHKK